MFSEYFFAYRKQTSNKGRNVDNIHDVNPVSITEFNHFRFKLPLLNPFLANIVCKCLHLSFFMMFVNNSCSAPVLPFRAVPDSLSLS